LHVLVGRERGEDPFALRGCQPAEVELNVVA
jgi:hypothetical protein